MISVVIPTFNRSRLLNKAIKSVLHQTYVDLELIVVDDGSEDLTKDLIESISDSRLKLIVQENHGVSHARNRGIEASEGEWICFLDSDDSWLPNKLERQIETLQDDPRYKIIYTNEIWIRNGVRVNQKKKHRKYSGWIYPFCLPLCIISPSSILLHRSIIENEIGFDEDYPVCEDYELWLRIASIHPIRFLDELLIYKYGGHEDQLSRSRWGLDIFRIKAMIKTYESGRLTPFLASLTAREIVSKAHILSLGFTKHSKQDEAANYRMLCQQYQALSKS